VKELKNDENLPIINKTKSPTKGEEKVQDGRTHKSWQAKNTPNRANHKGNKKKSST
jgi:hypothetical protein